MRDRTILSCARLVGALVLLAMPVTAAAQYSAPSLSTRAIGEKYRIELGGAIWNPTVSGVISSEQFGLIGTDIDFTKDLGFKKKSFTDTRLVLRAGKKHRFRVEYTPLEYQAETVFTRDIVFNGILYPTAQPVSSSFGWKVWRFGYEYDFIYRDRGFLGLLIEARLTEMNANLVSGSRSEFSKAKGPLPALGLVGRIYPLSNVSLTAEVSGFKLPNFDEKYAANYVDIDVYGTFNLTHHFGAQLGWRRMSTFLRFESDKGDLKFEGLWFGGVLRY